ncbi:AAA family ATPase [Pseudobutyrivibrio sp.]|uniref:AAA family ATPase n=1 Tax=Pseudobutyrivibrio sp. TaxID=2014367 RepID=UPI00386A90E8
MKKKSVINLIKYYSEGNDVGFRNESMEIAREFDETGDYQLAEYIMALLSDANVLVPQLSDETSSMFEKVEQSTDSLWLPDSIQNDLIGIVNAVSYNVGINKFLFQGRPGTGKTEAVKQIARILNRDIFMVNFSAVVDSKLGNTAKNIVELFREMKNFPKPQKLIILFDEIDAIALDRTNGMDHREMGRATSTILKELDRLDSELILIATTNLYEYFDKALIRRFDAVIDFNKYSKNELMDISEKFLDAYLSEFRLAHKDIRLFRKIIALSQENYSPAELKHLIRSAIAFSDINDEGDYFRRIYINFVGTISSNAKELKKQGFTVREIALLQNKSKSVVDRELKIENYE